MRVSKDSWTIVASALRCIAIVCVGGVPGAVARADDPAKGTSHARVIEDERAIKIETDKLEAVIPKKDPKHWMTGIEKGSFLDKTTGFRDVRGWPV
jgi:hypothetical protein